jgi:hypothetical protein
VFFLFFFYSVLFIGCSQENGITGPNLNQGEAMAKVAVVPRVKIDHTTDTVLTLPNSKVTITINKNISMKRIAAIDDYLVAEKTSPKSKSSTSTIQSLKPNLRFCQYEYGAATIWTSQNQYAPISGKYLGIYTDQITFSQACNQYGFSKIYVTSTSDMDNAYRAGFSYSNMMFGLAQSSYISQIAASNSGGRSVGSYEIDEPFENGVWQASDIDYVMAVVNPPTRVMLTSYKWPSLPYNAFVTYGAEYGSVTNPFSNAYIMCDEYHGNCFGRTYDYWHEFQGYYGANRNITNWMHVVINNGSGVSTSCSYLASSWDALLATADVEGINEVWLFADGTGNEAAIANCCTTCWQDQWLLQYQVGETYISINESTDCDPNGPWSIVESYSAGSRYAQY